MNEKVRFVVEFVPLDGFDADMIEGLLEDAISNAKAYHSGLSAWHEEN